VAASGRIGEQQLIDMGGRRERTDSTGQFDIALLHHHTIGKDAERFLEWLHERARGFVLHAVFVLVAFKAGDLRKDEG